MERFNVAFCCGEIFLGLYGAICTSERLNSSCLPVKNLLVSSSYQLIVSCKGMNNNCLREMFVFVSFHFVFLVK